ncbi:cytochrome p450 2j6 [Plakobranchus ocellatus]|uniref:Cytochrome p450 2j6 n=1 Tax=Plakobranchus ocellatus TaxID=259542 RepID=A0AAV4AMD4_9GAST|nr:cytochrome p450 2j6 [Plakobranchus ocellatus]
MFDFLLENSTSLLIFLVTALLVWYVVTLPRMRNMPPGPLPLPVFGNYWMFLRPGVTLLTLFDELTKKYGKMFTFKMGSKPIIFINELRLVQEAFVKRADITSNRPQHYYIINKIDKKVGLGVTLNNGQPWKQLRRVSVTAMRDFGVGKKTLEEKIYDEVVELLGVIDRQKGNPVDMKPFLMMATSNVISSVIFGNRFDLDDPKFKLLLEKLTAATSVNALFLTSNFLPFVRFFTNVLGNGRRVTYADREKLRFTEATIQEVLRVRPVAPFGFPRYVDQDFELGGYTIPKGAVAFANIVAINNDSAYFIKPGKFNPSRWLDEKGEISGRERLLSFSVAAMLDVLFDNSTTVLIFVVTALLVWYVVTLPSMRNMPPGPFPLPVLGNYLMLGKPGISLITLLDGLKKKYGEIFTFKIGSKPFIFISDLRLVQAAFVKRGDILSSRPRNYYVLDKIEERVGKGVSLSNGQPWKELRRVSLTAMRDFGVGKKSLEEKVLEEVTGLLDIIGQQKGKPVIMRPWLIKATSNVISNVWKQRLSEATNVNAIFLPANFFPLVRYFTNKEENIIKTLETTGEFIKELLADHGETFDPNNIRDFVDLVLHMRNSPTGRHFNDLNIRRTIVDIFNAGSETTATTLQWLLYYMATYPELQAKCQREIDEVTVLLLSFFFERITKIRNLDF